MRGNGQVTNYPKKTRLLVSRLVDAKERRQPAVIAQVLGELGTLFEETEDWPQTLKYARQELENAKLLPVSKRMEVQSQALYRMGRACRELGEFDACLKYQNEYLNVSEKLNNPQEKLQALMDLGVSYIGRGESEKPMPDDFRTAIDYLKKAGKQLSATSMHCFRIIY